MSDIYERALQAASASVGSSGPVADWMYRISQAVDQLLGKKTPAPIPPPSISQRVVAAALVDGGLPSFLFQFGFASIIRGDSFTGAYRLTLAEPQTNVIPVACELSSFGLDANFNVSTNFVGPDRVNVFTADLTLDGSGNYFGGGPTPPLTNVNFAIIVVKP